jgi:hypothetical protein
LTTPGCCERQAVSGVRACADADDGEEVQDRRRVVDVAVLYRELSRRHREQRRDREEVGSELEVLDADIRRTDRDSRRVRRAERDLRAEGADLRPTMATPAMFQRHTSCGCHGLGMARLDEDDIATVGNALQQSAGNVAKG